jgi:hypothetical protein
MNGRVYGGTKDLTSRNLYSVAIYDKLAERDYVSA